MLQLRGPGEIIIHFRNATLLLTPVYSKGPSQQLMHTNKQCTIYAVHLDELCLVVTYGNHRRLALSLQLMRTCFLNLHVHIVCAQ